MQPNQGYEYRERLDREAEGQTLLAYLSHRHRHSSGLDWAARIAAGQVLIDFRPMPPEHRLRCGSTLIWRRPPWVEPDVPRSFSVLYEDEDILAVAKPAGLPTLPGANYLYSTLLYQVRAYFPDAAPLHRLGRWTSGIVLFARNQKAGALLSQQWSTRQVTKRYRALAAGSPRFEELTVTTPIGPVPHILLGTLHAAAANGKPALSRVTVLERRADAFLCDVSIATGRPHQIRIHLAAADHPLLGDPLYEKGGLPSPETLALPGDPGYYLHAAELCFRHPRTGYERVIECEPPSLLHRSMDIPG